MEWIDRAAVGVRARRIDHTMQDAGVLGVQGHGMLDSGAAVPVVAMWLLNKLGIPVDEETKQVMHSVSGRLEAYNAEIAVEMQYGSRWLDMGTIKAAVPDTTWSRDPNSRWPFLLGLEGFFDRFDVCISHAKKSFCLGGIGDWAKDGMA